MFSDKIPLCYEEIIIAITLFKRPFYIAHLMIAITTNNYSNLITVVAKFLNSRNEIFLTISHISMSHFCPVDVDYSRVIFDHYHWNVPKLVKNVEIVWHQQDFLWKLMGVNHSRHIVTPTLMCWRNKRALTKGVVVEWRQICSASQMEKWWIFNTYSTYVLCMHICICAVAADINELQKKKIIELLIGTTQSTNRSIWFIVLSMAILMDMLSFECVPRVFH